MPITEAPPPQSPDTEGSSPGSPENRPSARLRRRRAGRLGIDQDAEGYDLLHVLDELEDERARVSLREKIWIALIVHLLLFAYIILAPKYIWHVQVRDNLNRQPKNKQLTFLALPPDALKQLQPKRPAPMSDKNRQQQAPHPVPQRRDLDAMRRAGPPVPKPTPVPKPAPPTPQVARQAPAPRPQQAQPAPKQQSAQIEAPKPRPNFATPAQTPGESIAQAERQAARGGATYGGGDMGANAPPQHPGDQGAVDVLSDTLGVDFGPYIQRVIYDTKRAWYPIIPEVAQPPIDKQGRVLIRFKILPDGSVKDMHLEGPSGDVSLDRAAWGAITGASPFPQLPKHFKGPYLELRFYFLYNQSPGVR